MRNLALASGLVGVFAAACSFQSKVDQRSGSGGNNQASLAFSLYEGGEGSPTPSPSASPTPAAPSCNPLSNTAQTPSFALVSTRGLTLEETEYEETEPDPTPNPPSPAPPGDAPPSASPPSGVYLGPYNPTKNNCLNMACGYCAAMGLNADNCAVVGIQNKNGVQGHAINIVFSPQKGWCLVDYLNPAVTGMCFQPPPNSCMTMAQILASFNIDQVCQAYQGWVVKNSSGNPVKWKGQTIGNPACAPGIGGTSLTQPDCSNVKPSKPQKPPVAR